jgi:mercuric ion transport protein
MRWLFPVGVVGSVIAALCCVGVLTPLLVAGLVTLGLGALTRSLDLILLPALGIFLVMAFLGWRARKSGAAVSPGVER